MKRCQDCAPYRKQLGGEDPCGKHGQCVGNPSLATILRDQEGSASHARVAALGELISVGFAAEEHKIRARKYPPVATAADLVKLALTIHRGVFGATELDFAGRFRRTDEGAEVDSRNATHRFVGAPSDEIARRVGELHHLFRDDGDPLGFEDAAHKGACLLESLFRIHPFIDGNGRTGRLLLVHLFLHRTRATVGTFPENSGKSERRYLKALRYAHSRRDRLRRDGLHVTVGSFPDPVRFLAAFLRPLLHDNPEPLTEQPPEWIAQPSPHDVEK